MASVSRVANFAARFCSELDNNKNLVCSPLSVEIILALTALGSNGESRAEIFKALDITNEDVLRSLFTSLTTTLDLKPTNLPDARDVTLKIANKIYVKQGEALKSDLNKHAIEVFKSSLEQIDFTKSAAAASSINSWVANQTNNVIKEVVSAKMLNETTGLVLVNAIYFHGFWKSPFKANNTYSQTFYVNDSKKVTIAMMTKDGSGFNFKHNKELKAKVLQMFYEGDQASMVIVLPDKVGGLSGVMKKLAAGYDLMTDIKSLKRTQLKVAIPKFKVETEINLQELLPKMGIKSIFNKDKSNINMLSSNEPLYVSEAIQKAYIAVDEKGTEAAAVTQMGIMLCSAPWWEEEFIADRPFLFILIAREIPIFYGIFKGN